MKVINMIATGITVTFPKTSADKLAESTFAIASFFDGCIIGYAAMSVVDATLGSSSNDNVIRATVSGGIAMAFHAISNDLKSRAKSEGDA